MLFSPILFWVVSYESLINITSCNNRHLNNPSVNKFVFANSLRIANRRSHPINGGSLTRAQPDSSRMQREARP